jgi:hypothetical protein
MNIQQWQPQHHKTDPLITLETTVTSQETGIVIESVKYTIPAGNDNLLSLLRELILCPQNETPHYAVSALKSLSEQYTSLVGGKLIQVESGEERESPPPEESAHVAGSFLKPSNKRRGSSESSQISEAGHAFEESALQPEKNPLNDSVVIIGENPGEDSDEGSDEEPGENQLDGSLVIVDRNSRGGSFSK